MLIVLHFNTSRGTVRNRWWHWQVFAQRGPLLFANLFVFWMKWNKTMPIWLWATFYESRNEILAKPCTIHYPSHLHSWNCRFESNFEIGWNKNITKIYQGRIHRSISSNIFGFTEFGHYHPWTLVNSKNLSDLLQVFRMASQDASHPVEQRPLIIVWVHFQNLEQFWPIFSVNQTTRPEQKWVDFIEFLIFHRMLRIWILQFPP